MKFVSPLLKRIIYPALHLSGAFPRFARDGELSVVTYHGVLPEGYHVTDPLLDGGWVTAQSFRKQLQLLRCRYHVVSPEQVRLWSRREAPLPERAVLLTCDDGLANASINMLPILREEKIPCLFFVTSESLCDSPAMLWYEELYLTFQSAPEGQLHGKFSGVDIRVDLNSDIRQRHGYWWGLVATLSTTDAASRLGCARAIREHFGMPADWHLDYVERQGPRFRLLVPGEVRQLLDGGMSIGSHTVSHPKLSLLPSAAAWMEISQSRVQLEQGLGISIWSIAYPFGGTDSVSRRELRMAERAGYDCAFVNFGGGFRNETERFGIRRLHVTLDMTLAEFEAHLCGLHEGLRRGFGHAERIPVGSDDETGPGTP